MRLKQVQQQIADMPTIMSLEDEVVVMKALMTLSDDVLRHETSWLVRAVQALRQSHRDEAFMELTEDNESDVHTFCDWLRARNAALSLGIADGVIKDLDMSAAQVQHLMAPYKDE